MAGCVFGGKCESETRARKLFPEAEAEVEERSKLTVAVVEPTAGDRGFEELCHVQTLVC